MRLGKGKEFNLSRKGRKRACDKAAMGLPDILGSSREGKGGEPEPIFLLSAACLKHEVFDRF